MLPLQKDRVIWYSPVQELPEVAGQEQETPRKPETELKRPSQTIRTDPRNTQDSKQFIYQAPPKLTPQKEVPSPNLLAFAPKPAPPLKKFVAPESPKATADPAPALLAAPSPLATAPASPAPLPLVAAITGPPSRPVRDFVAPANTPPGAPAGPAPTLDTAPSLSGTAETGGPTLAVIGLNPSANNNIPLPEGTLSPRLSVGASGPDKEAGNRANIVVPGLNVSGGRTNNTAGGVVQPPRKGPEPYHEPSATEWAQISSGKDSRRSARLMTSVALRPGARVISPWVEARFANRPVYTTSFEVGQDAGVEWVIWFAERGATPTAYSTIRPPIPWKRDSEAATLTEASGHVEVSAVINPEGVPDAVTVVMAGDPRTRDAAQEMVRSWRFLPTLRNGAPIEVDALIEFYFENPATRAKARR